MELFLIFFLVILIVLIVMLCLHYYTYYIDNDNIPQLDSIDKIEITSKCTLGYKMGIAFFRPWDINNLSFLYKEDPLMLNLYNKFKFKYGKIAVVDTYIKKLYVILDENIAITILEKNEDIIGAGKIKKIMFSKIMPDNLGVCNGYERKIKRDLNEKLFGTKHRSNVFSRLPSIIDKNIKVKPKNHKDFDHIAVKVISEILLGKTDKSDIYILKKTFQYIVNDTNVSLFGITNKFNDDMSPIIDYSNYLRNNFIKNSSIISDYNNYEKSNPNLKYKYLADEIPHWIIPMYGFMSFMIPILLEIILSFDSIYNTIMDEINQPFFDIYSKRTFLHYCVIEHLRLFNIINMHPVRETKKDIYIDNFKLQKGSEVLILFSSILRNPDMFEKPNSYNPSRWNNKSIDEQNIVFGVGAQECPSINFTPFIYKQYIHVLLTKFKFKTKENKYSLDNLPFINSFQLEFI